MKTYGVVLAGGVGARLGLSVPKQMVKVSGKTILEHTVAALHDSAVIDEMIVMVTPGWSERTATILADKYPKVSRILEGGASRNETTMRVLNAIEDEEAKILLHDAVRPLVDGRILGECATALDSYNAVDVVIPSADTIVTVDADDIITHIPDRGFLRRGQTPQGFKLSVLRAAYELAAEDPYFSATDDCGVVLKYLPDVRTKTIQGSDRNMKVTYPLDMYIVDKFFQLGTQEAPLPEGDLRDHFSGKTIVVLGGSYGIGAEIDRLARGYGATVVAHGRSTTGLHVEDAEQIARAFEKTAREHGQIDAVVLTAGVLQMGRLADASPEDVAKVINVNYLAPVNVARAAYPYLKQSGGHLLNFTSSSYTRGRENYALYSSTKAAVVNLTQALSEEWAADDIKVNVINPERAATPMRLNAFGEEAPGSLLSAEAVAEASLEVLASELTGAVIDVRRQLPRDGSARKTP
ncbi:bifunctional cytidylyltransferase/SDR family oxidoreductase [Flexivirga caeni]|uniref:2-C-methyl-D-erythritol 4-phosphate cytidylyltransferase n=1 Tax=Flexivirga caeni TaxID=2294115 RepID=A0A3M9M924_9MICO|nr:bifunctional cytidylyltransferase/SDR family oxidoreductase [Flexivirga caeni]RNI21048.1 SDR family NAD(P)-dependent oxidoreductase [Flexivirga caeni]